MKNLIYIFVIILFSFFVSCLGKSENNSSDNEVNISNSNQEVKYEIIVENNAFIDAERICGFWSIIPNTIDTEQNLKYTPYNILTIIDEKKEDYYNKYIGKMSIFNGGDSSILDILSINKISENKYEFHLANTYGISGGIRPIITYGTIHLTFAEQDTIIFEILEHDKKTDHYEYFFYYSFVYYRAIIDNSLIVPDEIEPIYWFYTPSSFIETHIVINDNVNLYEEPHINSNVIMVLGQNSKIQVIDMHFFLGREPEVVTIENITAPLIWIKTKNEITGWLFEGYLRRINE